MYDVYGNLLIGAKQKDGSILKRDAAKSFAVQNLVPLPTLSMKAVCGKTFRRENVRSNGMQSASTKTDFYSVTSEL